MMIPLLIFFLIRPVSANNHTHILKQLIFDTFVAGIVFAYMVHSGYLSLMLPSILAIIIVGTIHGLLYPSSRLLFWLRLAGSGLTGILLSFSKLVTISYIMDNFTRSGYKLSGADGFISSAWLILKSIFISPAFDPARITLMVNRQWGLSRHEWEFSLTIVPLLIIIRGLIQLGLSIKKEAFYSYISRIKKQIFELFIITVLLFVPVALNTYSPSWNAFLKKIPYIKSASSLIRWYIIYIPFVCLITSLVIEKMVRPKMKWPLVLISMVFVVGFNAFTDRQYYHFQFYNPENVQKAYTNLNNDLWTPEIKDIVVCLNENGQIVKPLYRNDALILNGSQLLCYEPLLGYRLEYFPFKTLHPGPVLEENEGVLNIKNPACYVWPEANSCDPGDHFTAEQKDEATAFGQYRPFNFKMPALPRFANWFNVVFLVVVVLYLGFYGSTYLIASRKKIDI
ncbi:hypothetical protein ACFL3R_01130 [Thermodesulfobacteriota bacterium]